MNITIYLHNGATFSANVTGYDSTTLALQLNDPKLLMLAVGDVIVNKNSVQLIAPTPVETSVE
jgi:sRNA-binding regulator protein Hfq